jgi:hypothetical protein
MIIPSSIYMGNEGRVYLATYNPYPDVHRAAPPSAPNSLRVAHAVYGYQGSRKAIDIFKIKTYGNSETSIAESLKNFELDFNEIQYKRAIPHLNNLEFVDIRNDITYIMLNDYPHNEEVKNLIRKDVLDFCKNPSSLGIGTTTELLEEIIGRMVLRETHQKTLLRGGKQEFVRACGLEANLDFSYGCISDFVNGFLNVFAGCGYCYAAHNHLTFSKTIIKIDKKQLIEELLGGYDPRWFKELAENGSRKIKILRFGKRTETGSVYTREKLLTSLEACVETETRGVIPTKYLEYDPLVAELVKRTNTKILFSIGWNELETGACSHGCTNEFRIEQAIKYKEAKIDPTIYLLIDAPRPPGKREEGILKTAEQHKIQVQLLPVRIPSNKIAKIITGMSWDELTKDMESTQYGIGGVREDLHGGGYVSKSGVLTAYDINHAWQKMMGNNNTNIRMCHHNDKQTFCGGCFQRNGIIIPTEHVNIEYAKIRKGNWRKRKNNKNLKLFPDLK